MDILVLMVVALQNLRCKLTSVGHANHPWQPIDADLRCHPSKLTGYELMSLLYKLTRDVNVVELEQHEDIGCGNYVNDYGIY